MPVAAFGVEGGVFANLVVNLHDPNNDGRIRFSELADEIKEGPLCIFDTSGDVHAGLDAYVKVGFNTPFGFVTLYEDHFDIANKVVLNLDHQCDGAPVLASQSGGTVTLNIGALAGERSKGTGTGTGTEGFTAENYFIRGESPAEDANGNGQLDPGEDQNGNGRLDGQVDLNGNGTIEDSVIEVSAFGFKEVFSGVTLIVGDAGSDNDSIVLDPSVKVNSKLTGGAGDDLIVGGSGIDTIDGNEDNDTLIGGKGNDAIRGQDGNDLIFGNAGADWLDGGPGDDTIYGGNGTDAVDNTGDLADVIFGGPGNDNLYGNRGDDRIGARRVSTSCTAATATTCLPAATRTI